MLKTECQMPAAPWAPYVRSREKFIHTWKLSCWEQNQVLKSSRQKLPNSLSRGIHIQKRGSLLVLFRCSHHLHEAAHFILNCKALTGLLRSQVSLSAFFIFRLVSPSRFIVSM